MRWRWFFTLGIPFVSPAIAQETVFNVPSGDILNPGQLYIEIDGLYRPSSTDRVWKASSLTFRGVSGIAKDLEAGINLGGLYLAGASSPVLLAAVKYGVLRAASSEWIVAVGGEAGRGLRSGSGWVERGYLKADFKPAREVRIGIGAYQASSGYYDVSGKFGGLLSLEWNATSWIIPAVDCLTGSHSSALLSAGAILTDSTQKNAFYLAGFRNAFLQDSGLMVEYGHYW